MAFLCYFCLINARQPEFIVSELCGLNISSSRILIFHLEQSLDRRFHVQLASESLAYHGFVKQTSG